MCQFKNAGVSWPPRGWELLDGLESSEAQAMTKDPLSATVKGLSYDIEAIPVSGNNSSRQYIYNIQITAWDYNIYNEISEYPVLSFILKERISLSIPHYKFMADIKSLSCPIAVSKHSAQRSYMAAVFLMKQITAGQVPHFDKVLKLYKIHPTQLTLYEANQNRLHQEEAALNTQNILD